MVCCWWSLLGLSIFVVASAVAVVGVVVGVVASGWFFVGYKSSRLFDGSSFVCCYLIGRGSVVAVVVVAVVVAVVVRFVVVVPKGPEFG